MGNLKDLHLGIHEKVLATHPQVTALVWGRT